MYYAGTLERKYDLRFPMAIAMENQTLPFGLISLWAGSGRSIPGKASAAAIPLYPAQVIGSMRIYWAAGPDGSQNLDEMEFHAGK